MSALLLQMVREHLPREVCYSGVCVGGRVGVGCPTLKLLGVCFEHRTSTKGLERARSHGTVAEAQAETMRPKLCPDRLLSVLHHHSALSVRPGWPQGLPMQKGPKAWDVMNLLSV